MRAQEQTAFEFYTQPAVMTSAGRHAPLLQGLPRDVAGLAAVAQGLLIHEHLAHGVTLTDADRASVHIRPVEEMLAQIVARDDRPLDLTPEPATWRPCSTAWPCSPRGQTAR